MERYDWSAVGVDFEEALLRRTAGSARSAPSRDSAPRLRPQAEARTPRTAARARSEVGNVKGPHRAEENNATSVFGLGYVGSVSAASFAADSHAVIGVDVTPTKVASLNEGRSPIVEKGLDELIRDNTANGRLRATQHGGSGPRHGPIAHLRRHAEPEERQPRPHLSGTRRRADRRGARQERLTTWSSSGARFCRDDARSRDPGAGRRTPGRSRSRRPGTARRCSGPGATQRVLGCSAVIRSASGTSTLQPVAAPHGTFCCSAATVLCP